MNSNLLELHLLNQMKLQLKMRQLESDLIEQFDFAFNWIMKVAEDQHADFTNKEGLFSCLKRIDHPMNEIYGESAEVKRWKDSPGVETEPNYSKNEKK